MTVQADRRWTIAIFVGALALFATSVTGFRALPTDLSALRVLDGDVPYRDFWTMYAPGSFLTLAAAFAVVGRELIVSNILGIITSAAAVAMYYRVAVRACGGSYAAVLAALVAIAFFCTGYQVGFTSYPPAFLLIVTAVDMAARRSADRGAAPALAPGLLLGIAALYKHDVAGYETIAVVVALGATRARARIVPAWMPSLVLGAVAAGVVGIAAAVLIALGAGRDAWLDVIRFPLVDFRYVRGEYFPLVPHWRGSIVLTIRDLSAWSICNVPLIALAAGVLWIRRASRPLDAPARFLVVFCAVAFGLHWVAAHVQLNTNAITLTAWGGLVAAVGLRSGAEATSTVRTRVAVVAALELAAMFAAPRVYLAARDPSPQEWVGLPRLRGITASTADTAWMRELSAAMTTAADANAPLLFVSRRNDIDVFAAPAPFWLSARRPATRYHEPHPGITDTAPVQREILERLAHQPPPVVVREHRFDDATLEPVKEDMLKHVPIGSTLLDEWIGSHYEAGPMFGMYEVMKKKP